MVESPWASRGATTRHHQRHMPPPCDFGSDDEPRRAMICRQAQRSSPRREGCGSGPGSSPCSVSGADSSGMEPPRTGAWAEAGLIARQPHWHCTMVDLMGRA